MKTGGLGILQIVVNYIFEAQRFGEKPSLIVYSNSPIALA